MDHFLMGYFPMSHSGCALVDEVEVGDVSVGFFEAHGVESLVDGICEFFVHGAVSVL